MATFSPRLRIGIARPEPVNPMSFRTRPLVAVINPDGNTSEFAAARSLGDVIFRDDYEG